METQKQYYLLVHFIGDFEDGEQIYFSVSKDGFHWTDLNGGSPLLRTKIGEKGARDPFILRSHDGNKFYIVATDLKIAAGRGWQAAQFEGSHCLLVWESWDLVNWSEAVLREVAIEGAGCVWAPEAVYDEEKGEYMVFWASMVKEENDSEGKHRIYCSYTKDFKTFSKAVKYIERPQSVIDTTIVYDKGMYYRFSKDETAKTIQLDAGKKLQGDFKHIKSEVLDNLYGVEGPACYPLWGDKGWCLIVDRFAEGKGYMPILCKDLSTGNFTIADEGTFDMGKTRKRHGSVLVIDEDEYNRLTKEYLR
jgi:sucrose-6-phosphate hydrolase SacC (GH32 family)